MNKAFEKILDRLEEELIPLNQEITRYFYELKDTDNPKYIYAVGRSNALTDFKYDIKQLAEEFATDTNVGNNGWIPCSERLPNDLINVLVWFEYYRFGNYNGLYQTIGISYTNNGEWSRLVNGTSGWKELRIIAWQPLPHPYKGGENL